MSDNDFYIQPPPGCTQRIELFPAPLPMERGRRVRHSRKVSWKAEAHK